MTLTAPLTHERFLVLSTFDPTLFESLKKLESQSNPARWLMIIFSLLAFYISYLLYRLRYKEDELERHYQSQSEKVEKIAMVDTLTGAMTRRKFDETIQELLHTGEHFSHQFSLILFDIDDFKKVNDTYGHDAGDIVLQRVANHVKSHIRQSDQFARWGGEEFVIITPVVDPMQAVHLAEKLCQSIAALTIDPVGHITCSFGVSVYRKGCSQEALFKQADEYLYKAKKSGKNRVIYSPC